MKLSLLKLTSLLSSSFAVTALLLSVVLTTNPVTAKPAIPSTTMTAAQFRGKLFQGVNLTPDQQNKIKGIREMRLRRLKAALSTSQYHQIKQSLNGGKTVGQAVTALQPPLSSNQKQRIDYILTDTTDQIWKTLTPAQQQVMEANLKAMQQPKSAVE